MIKTCALGPVLLALVSSCGLVNELENFKGVNFQLPVRKYSVSTDDPRWYPPPDGFPAIPCGPGGLIQDCCAPPAPLPTIDCKMTPLACEGGVCALEFTYEQVQSVDLAMEVPSLAGSKGKIFSEMLLTTIDVTIEENTLNVSLPPVNIYLAPAAVTSSSDPGAQRIGTMSTKAAGFTGADSIKLDDASQKLFSRYANDFQTPFNIIIGTTVVFKSGSVVPKGKISFAVGGKVSAKF